MDALNKQALRILRLFGNDTLKYVRTAVGPEQEYFLVDKEMYKKRRDLIFTGRTLFGAKPPKGQEMDDHYFGVIKPRVAAYTAELNQEPWKLGILAKTEHNEVAPAQHELAPIYTTTNIATDHNQLTMEIMQKAADKHGLVCLLHEKPFAAVLEALENDTPYAAAEKTQMKLGAKVLPRFQRDTTDRNRTSSFAFTGSKFEFRMLGSSNSIACANIMLNAAVAQVLKEFADELEGKEDFDGRCTN